MPRRLSYAVSVLNAPSRMVYASSGSSVRGRVDPNRLAGGGEANVIARSGEMPSMGQGRGNPLPSVINHPLTCKLHISNSWLSNESRFFPRIPQAVFEFSDWSQKGFGGRP